MFLKLLMKNCHAKKKVFDVNGRGYISKEVLKKKTLQKLKKNYFEKMDEEEAGRERETKEISILLLISSQQSTISTKRTSL